MANPRYILDTGPLVAFANASDTHHRWAVEVLNSLGEPPVTCEIVLAEAFYLLASSQRAVDLILALPKQGQVTVEPIFDHKSDFVRIAVAKILAGNGCSRRLCAATSGTVFPSENSHDRSP